MEQAPKSPTFKEYKEEFVKHLSKNRIEDPVDISLDIPSKSNEEKTPLVDPNVQKYSGAFSPQFYAPKLNYEEALPLAKEQVKNAGYYVPSAAGTEKQISAEQQAYDLFNKNKPEEKRTEKIAKESRDYSDYLKSFIGKPEEKENLQKALESAKEMALQLPAKIEALSKEYPDVKREDLMNQYGFARKLLIGVLGGVGGHPDILNEYIDKQVKRNNDEFDYRLDKLIKTHSAPLEEVQKVLSAGLQTDTLMSRSMQASIAAANAEYDQEIAPLKKLQILKNIGVLEQQIQPLYEDILNKKMALDDLSRSLAEAYANNPLGVVTRNPMTGQEDQVVAKSQDIYDDWVKGDLKGGKPPRSVVFDVAQQNIMDIRKLLDVGGYQRLTADYEIKRKYNEILKDLYPFNAKLETGYLFDNSSHEEKIQKLNAIQKYMDDYKQQNFQKPRVSEQVLYDLKKRMKK